MYPSLCMEFCGSSIPIVINYDDRFCHYQMIILGPAPSNPTSHHRHLNITGSGISTLAEGGSPEHDLEDTLEDTIHCKYST